MVHIIPNFIVLHFGVNFMKIQTKIAKLQIHEILHKNVNENMFSCTFLYKNLHKNVNKNMFSCTFYANFHEFYEGQLKQQICYSFILLILIYLNLN